MKDKATFDIIITSFNRLKYLKRCLTSVKKHTNGFNYRITVVDNGSRDGTKKYLRNRQDINFISFKRNFGPARAFNKGLKVTSGEFVARLDDDTEVTPGWLGGLFNSLVTQEKIGIVGAKAVFKSGYICFAEDLPRFYSVYSGGGIDRGQKDYIRFCDVVSGSGMLFRRSLIEEIGYFDEKLKCYVDTDFCIRARIAGFRIVYNGKVKVIHHLLFRYRNVVQAQKKFFHRKWKNIKDFPLKDSHPADKYNTWGLDCLINGNYMKALNFLRKVEASDRRFALPFFIAVALWGVKREKETLARLRILLRENPQDYGAKHFLGLVYLKKKNYQKAFQLIKESITLEKFENYQPELSEAVYRIATSG